MWAEHTNPNADADDHGYSWGAVAERFERVDGDVAAITAHGRQGDAGGLDCHLVKTENICMMYTYKMELLGELILFWGEI